MKRLIFNKIFTVGLLLAAGNAAMAEADEASSCSPVSVGFELNSSTTKYTLDAVTGDPLYALFLNSSTKLLILKTAVNPQSRLPTGPAAPLLRA
ncbi:MAG: hypothetical protein HY273_03945 [Gammaproteobacteria bacterium]|nr:hypothetical protein [Gammaproteobacteria bacterium]